MLKRVLVLSLLWPFLLPPGFCLCRLDKFGLRSAGAAAPGEPDPTPPRCRCCRPKPSPNTRLTEQKPDAPHLPFCPAHPNWEVARAAALSIDVGSAGLPPCDVGPIVDDTYFAWASPLAPLSPALIPPPLTHLRC